ncbi:MAG: ribonuclease [Blautia sp.]|nr:ribonuclease [Blautia sp.]
MLGYGGISAFLDGGAVFSRVAGVRTASEKPSAAKKKKNSGSTSKASDSSGSSSVKVKEDGTYTGKEEVAAYIHEFGHLPSNYITKNEAKDLGWDSRSGNLDEVAPGKSIGGDKFGNYEGLLPTKSGRKYYECDIDFEGGRRNAKRIIFSNDGLIYYTEDHYETFEQLY